MAKKPAAGAPAWMATFADLMSLLLVLFVLLLTFAEMDVVKYKQIAGSIRAAFGFSKEDQLAGVIEMDGSLLGKSLSNPQPDTPRVVSTLPPAQTPQVKIEQTDTAGQKAQKLEDSVGTVLKNMGLDDKIAVERKKGDVIIRFPDDIAFPSGSAYITDEFAAILNRIMPVIQQTDGMVVVSGHTDNVPLSSKSHYRSNWELSAARATSVLHWMIEENRMDPTRLFVQGFGDSRPIASNDSAEGRAKNRRVEVTIEMQDGTVAGSGEGSSPDQSFTPSAQPAPVPDPRQGTFKPLEIPRPVMPTPEPASSAESPSTTAPSGAASNGTSP